MMAINSQTLTVAAETTTTTTVEDFTSDLIAKLSVDAEAK
jgi:hypothetical protein